MQHRPYPLKFPPGKSPIFLENNHKSIYRLLYVPINSKYINFTSRYVKNVCTTTKK